MNQLNVKNECEKLFRYMYIIEHINEITFNLIGNVFWSTDDYLKLLNQTQTARASLNADTGVCLTHPSPLHVMCTHLR